MRRIHDYAIAALICAGAVVASATRANQSTPSPQVTLEHQFDAAIDVGEMLYLWLKRMSSEPNHVGSPHDRANAEWRGN